MNLAEVWQSLEEDTSIPEVSGRVQRRIGANRPTEFLPRSGDALKESNADPSGLGEFG